MWLTVLKNLEFPSLSVAFLAEYVTAFLRLERNFAFLATLCACRLVHLSRSKISLESAFALESTFSLESAFASKSTTISHVVFLLVPRAEYAFCHGSS